MIRRPPKSTRTEHTLSLHDALPISRVFLRLCRILRFTQKPEGPKKSEIPAFAGTTRACLAPPASEAPFTPTGNARKTRLLTEARAAEAQRSGISSHDHLGPGDHLHRHLRDGELEPGDGHHLDRPGARHQIAGPDLRSPPFNSARPRL